MLKQHSHSLVIFLPALKQLQNQANKQNNQIRFASLYKINQCLLQLCVKCVAVVCCVCCNCVCCSYVLCLLQLCVVCVAVVCCVCCSCVLCVLQARYSCRGSTRWWWKPLTWMATRRCASLTSTSSVSCGFILRALFYL